MSLANMSSCNGQEVPRMITLHGRGVTWSPKNELAYIVGGGDGYTHIKHGEKPTDEFVEFDGAIAGGEPFLSILHKRRLTKKAAEDIEYKWKQTVKPDVESIKEHVLDLVSKLKKQFSHEKQARKQHTVNVSDSTKYVWNNSVDSFLRHHEKPKIDIRYSQSDDDQLGEGLFTFAVRPSRIRKREMREKAHVCTVPQNIKEEASHVKVSGNQNEVVSEGVINNTVAMHNEEALDNEKHFVNIVASCQKKFPIKEPPTTAAVYNNEEHPPDEVLKEINTPSRGDMLRNESVSNVGVSSRWQPPPGKAHCTSPSKGDLITSEDRCLTGSPQNHDIITDITEDECDDDSPFGIMSVYCRSELHSMCCTSVTS